jgi:hypothetical protein
MANINTNTIGSAYWFYQSIGIVLVSVIVGLVGVALILAKRVTKQGRVIGGLLMALSGVVLFTTYKISKRPKLRSNVGKITLVGDAITKFVA